MRPTYSAGARARPAAVAAVALAGATLGLTLAPSVAVSAASGPPTASEIRREHRELLATFDPRLPGRGLDVTHPETVRSEATAFGTILAAEGLRYHVTRSRAALRRARICGRWLLRNGDLDRDGIVGWGLPTAFDAFGDGTLNPPHHEYTVTTFSIINKLLDWRLFDRRAPSRKIHAAIRRGVAPYLRGRRSRGAGRTPSGMFGYSLRRADRHWDVYNVGAFAAGVLQRLSRRVGGRGFRRRVRAAANDNIRVLARTRRLSPAGNTYWHYGTEPGSGTNELGHAAIIISGIRSYQRTRGALRGRFKRGPLLGHIDEFRLGKTWLRHPTFETMRKREPLGGTGGLPIGLAFRERRFKPLIPGLIREILRLEYAPGRYATGRPGGPRSTVRGQAGVLRSFSEYLYGGRARYGLF